MSVGLLERFHGHSKESGGLEKWYAGLCHPGCPRVSQCVTGDTLEPGRSTERFWSELRLAITAHDSALGELSRLRIVTTGDPT